MRMGSFQGINNEQNTLTAEIVVNEFSEKEIADILYTVSFFFLFFSFFFSLFKMNFLFSKKKKNKLIFLK